MDIYPRAVSGSVYSGKSWFWSQRDRQTPSLSTSARNVSATRREPKRKELCACTSFLQVLEYYASQKPFCALTQIIHAMSSSGLANKPIKTAPKSMIDEHTRKPTSLTQVFFVEKKSKHGP